MVQKLERWEGILEKAASLQGPVDEARHAQQNAETAEMDANVAEAAAKKELDEIQALQRALPVHTKAISDATTNLAALEREAEITGQYDACMLKKNQQATTLASLIEDHKKAGSYRQQVIRNVLGAMKILKRQSNRAMLRQNKNARRKGLSLQAKPSWLSASKNLMG